MTTTVFNINFLTSIFMFFLLQYCAFGQELTAREIIKKSEDNLRGTTSSKMEMTVTTVRPKWSREMGMKIWSLGNDYSLILITSPSKDAGITFLKRKKEVWNWVPSIERNIKLPPSMMAQSWMGTDLTNDDLVRESSTVDDYEHYMMGSAEIDGKSCYKIRLIPKENTNVVYDKIIVWIDKENFVQRRTENYDEDDELMVVTKASAVKNLEGRYLATRLEYLPMDKKGQKTIMEITSVDFDINIAESFFTIQNMKKVK